MKFKAKTITEEELNIVTMNNLLTLYKVDFLKAPLWICGHQHVKVDSVIAGTEFLMNPLGYPFESTFKNFKLKSFNL